MANNNLFVSIIAFLFVVINVLAGSALAGRHTAATGGGGDDDRNKLVQPESFVDGKVLVPGLGRYYLFPRPGTHFDPFTYNPVTGNSGSGTGLGTGTPGGSRFYIPGGDDTFIPNPGVEVPIPGGGGSSTFPPAADP